MTSVNPYLNFGGNSEEVLNFYAKVFHTQIAMMMRYGDSPGQENLPAEQKNALMHGSLPLGNTMLMVTDAFDTEHYKLNPGNNFSLSINTDSKEETDRIFNELSEGGSIQLKPENTFWGAYFGMCTDKFGVQWMLSFDEQRKAQ